MYYFLIELFGLLGGYWIVWAVYLFWILTNPLLVILFANIFCHPIGCLHFANGVLCCAKAIYLGPVIYFYFCFCFLCFRRDRSKNILLWLMSESVPLMFSSRSFMVSGLIFRSLIYFESVYSIRKCPNVILLHVAAQFSQYHLLKRVFFLHVYSRLLDCRLTDRQCVSLLLSPPSSPVDLCACFVLFLSCYVHLFYSFDSTCKW